MRFIIKIGCVCAGMAISGAYADETQSAPTPDQLFASYLNSDSYRTALNLAFNAVEPEERKNGCPELKVVQSNLYTPLQAPTFGGSGMNRIVVSGTWIAAPIFDQCGKQVKRRAIIQFINGNFKPTGLLPGDFHGDLTLERDSRRIVFPLLMAKTDCRDLKSIVVLDTVGPHDPGQQSWTEVWKVKACGKDVSATVTFDKHPDGIAVSAATP